MTGSHLFFCYIWQLLKVYFRNLQRHESRVRSTKGYASNSYIIVIRLYFFFSRKGAKFRKASARGGFTRNWKLLSELVRGKQSTESTENSPRIDSYLRVSFWTTNGHEFSLMPCGGGGLVSHGTESRCPNLWGESNPRNSQNFPHVLRVSTGIFFLNH